MSSPNIAFRAINGLTGELADRTRGDDPPARHLSETARRDLTRYYAAIAADLATVRLTPGEAAFLCALLNGTFVDDQLVTVRHLAHEILDSEEDGLPGQWGVDAGQLAETVSGWTIGQRLAVVDAAERFWRAQPSADHEAVLCDVGLLRTSATTVP